MAAQSGEVQIDEEIHFTDEETKVSRTISISMNHWANHSAKGSTECLNVAFIQMKAGKFPRNVLISQQWIF